MPDYIERIKPTDYYIRSYIDDLRACKYQIPTFQRDVVWERDAVKKLWDSVYRFYPVGSILIWKTDVRLHNHRSVGGHDIVDDNITANFQYILDGQQRTTSLLTSLYGGEIEGQPGFNPLLYIDLTIDADNDPDDQSYKRQFLFWEEIDDRNGRYSKNTQRTKRYQDGLIVKLKDVMLEYGNVERRLWEAGYIDFNDPIRERLRQIKDVLDKYRLAAIELKGIEVSEVCEIFERINQEGKPLDIFDIVVAKTYRLPENGDKGFYLRDLVDKFREKTESSYSKLDNLTYLQILAVIIRNRIPEAGIQNITPTFLNRMRTEHIEAVWPSTTQALPRLFDFFYNHLHLKGPRLIPYRYFYLTLATHFYENRRPNYEFLKKYFWYYCFHNEDLLTSTTHVHQQVELLKRARTETLPRFPATFYIDKHKLRSASYNARSRLSTAIMALLSNQEPRDWRETDRHVLSDVYFSLTDKPNLHHIFPVDFMKRSPGNNQGDVNSLMNIAYLTQLTNNQIGAKNPLDYLREFAGPNFSIISRSHLLPQELMTWVINEELPDGAFDTFIEKRTNLIVETLRQKLDGIPFEVFDSRSEQAPRPI